MSLILWCFEKVHISCGACAFVQIVRCEALQIGAKLDNLSSKKQESNDDLEIKSHIGCFNVMRKSKYFRCLSHSRGLDHHFPCRTRIGPGKKHSARFQKSQRPEWPKEKPTRISSEVTRIKFIQIQNKTQIHQVTNFNLESYGYTAIIPPFFHKHIPIPLWISLVRVCTENQALQNPSCHDC